jgi:AraC-like DNA-binding protein
VIHELKGGQMHYGNEFLVEIGGDVDPQELSRSRLDVLFQDAKQLSAFESTPDHNFIHDLTGTGIEGLLCYRINRDSMIEINDAYMPSPIVIRNEVSDVVTFQFVLSVKRSEFLGDSKHVHDLGPALLVSAIPQTETTYRVPKTKSQIRHVAVHTTLSNLLRRMSEENAAYPAWLEELLNGKHTQPRQRVFFLESVHRDPIWSCFHLPVSGSLLGQWISAKFDELLCIGLQILKNSCKFPDQSPLDLDHASGDKIRQARRILGMKYANPPPVPQLARQLGLSETGLKKGFKALNGTTVMQYCIEKRIDAAQFLLRENRHSISEVGSIVGYEDHSAFSRAFRRLSGKSPRDWRRSNSVDFD